MRWFTGLGLNTRILMLCGLPLVITAVITTVVVHRSTRRFVEDAIGEQMVMQARIVSHLVAIAQQEKSTGMTPEAINEHFKQITRFAKEHGNYDYEFWVTDSSGKVRLGSQGVEFTFKPDQPQAGTFLRLLDGHSNHTDVVVQESRRREIDPPSSSLWAYPVWTCLASFKSVTGPTPCSPTLPGRIHSWRRGCWPAAGHRNPGLLHTSPHGNRAAR